MGERREGGREGGRKRGRSREGVNEEGKRVREGGRDEKV